MRSQVVPPIDCIPTAPMVHAVEIAGRGSPLVWECDGPPGAPSILLLHGVTMTAELAWSRIIARLGQSYRVVAPDLRGHGDGIPCGSRFSLEECADDVAALAEALNMERVIVVGYSMGGIVAQLLWRRHRKLVAGLVLCATARNVRGSPIERFMSLTLPVITSAMQWNPAAQALTSQVLGESMLGPMEDADTRAWARHQLNRTSLSSALAAVQAVSGFTSHEWIGEVDVPTAVVITTQDRLVPASRQRRLASAIPHARVVELAADHGVCVGDPEAFCRAITTACALVLPPARKGRQ
jgi:3-oxoadipate enol-lactonase